MIPLFYVPRTVRFIETECRTMFTHSGGGNGEFLLNGYKVSVLEDEKSSEDGQWSRLHNNVTVLNATELYT